MRKFDLRILWGGLLVVVGGLFLLQEVNLIPSAWGLIWSLIFGIAGILFLYTYWRDRSQWWPLIPGFGLLSLGVLILLDEFIPGADWTGAIFLGAMGASFFLVYLFNKENWWAVIPGGILSTLTFVVLLEPFLPGDASGGVAMLGFGITFFILGILPISQGKMKWSFIPGSILTIIGVLLLGSSIEILNYLWPVVLILLGGYFILRNFTKIN